jgi:hypothetical protein
MAKLLSQLADLSVHAKNAEDAVAAAANEAHGKIETRKEQARAAAAKATEKVDQEIKSAGDTAVRNWTAVRAKVAADIDRLKASVAGAKHDLDTRHAEHHAERLEWEAESPSIMPLPRLSRQSWPSLMLSPAAPRPRERRHRKQDDLTSERLGRASTRTAHR